MRTYRISDNQSKQVISQERYRDTTTKVQDPQKELLKKIFLRLPTMVGQQKFLFIERLKYLLHHSEDTSFSKN